MHKNNNESKKNEKINLDLKFIISNIKIKSKTFGDVELKHFSYFDFSIIKEELQNIKNDREFTCKIIYKQLIKPKLAYNDLSKISDDELRKIAKDFIKNGKQIFEYFEDTTNKEFFNNFRNAINKFYDKKIKNNLNSLNKIISSSTSAIEKLSKQYSLISIEHAIKSPYLSELSKASSTIEELSKGIISNTMYERSKNILSMVRDVGEVLLTEYGQMVKNIYNAFSDLRVFTFNEIIDRLKYSSEQYILYTQTFLDSLSYQTGLWNNWIEENRTLFSGYSEFWRLYSEEYKITEQEAIKILKIYKWFITPSLPREFVFQIVEIGKEGGNKRGLINRLFINYFISNNCKNLKNLVYEWEENELFKPRMKIFRDCVYVLKETKNSTNPSNILLPTLIAQIDGIQTEFMKKNGLLYIIKNKKGKRHGRWIDKKGKQISKQRWFNNLMLNDTLLNSAKYVFLNILFQGALYGESLKIPFIFNRHKIMHGESLRYGRIDNTIRAFLILDFLASLK